MPTRTKLKLLLLPWPLLATVTGCHLSPEVAREPVQDEGPSDVADAMTDIETGFVSANRARIFYQSMGSGPAIVFVHGSSGNGDLWEQQLSAFSSAGYRAIAFDLRGVSRSRPDAGFESSFTIAEDIEAIRQGLDLGSIILVGQAHGAEGVLDYAIGHGENLKAFIVSASYRGAENELEFTTLRDQLLSPSVLTRTGIEMRLSRDFIVNNPEKTARFIEIDEASRRDVLATDRVDTEALLSSLQKSRTHRDYATLGRIEVPGLFLSAERDDVTPPELMRELAEHVPGAQYETVPDAGRYSFWENPAAFNDVVLSYLTELE